MIPYIGNLILTPPYSTEPPSEADIQEINTIWTAGGIFEGDGHPLQEKMAKFLRLGWVKANLPPTEEAALFLENYLIAMNSCGAHGWHIVLERDARYRVVARQDFEPGEPSTLAFSVAMTPPCLISELKISLKVLGLTCALDGVVGTSKSF